MEQYITEKTRLASLTTVVLITFLLAVFIISCADEFEKTDEMHNLSLTTRAGETAAQQIPFMKLFTFNYGGVGDKTFNEEILNITRTTTTLSAQVKAGQWHMVLVSNPNGGTILRPTASKLMTETPLYKFEPTYGTGIKTTDAHEIYLDNKITPVISANTPESMTATLNRTVARVDLIIEKTTPNFKLSSTKHKIKLHNIPSTISYTGDLLPSAANPDTLNRALEAPVTLVDLGSGSYKGSEKISFIIPAHRGDAYTSATPTDLIGLKMDVTVALERAGGSMFSKQVEIPIVAQCNRILEVKITVNDGLEFKTDILDWDGVDMESSIGAGYQNWLYVKQGARGNGLSWSDPLPDINSAMTKASLLKSAGKTVNGILVAGGSGLIYNESLNIPADIKIYGGWGGIAGTELAANDITGPHTSTNRNLKTNKAHLMTGAGNVVLSGANTVFDGFVVSGTGSGSVSGLVAATQTTSWINAVEIKGQTINSANALTLTNGTATNILVCDNSAGVAISGNGKLINATIVKNLKASTFTGTLLNAIYWGNAGNVTASGTIKYCAFQGVVPTGASMSNLYPLHTTNNTAWFTTANQLPGPHFNEAETPTLPKYFAGTSNPNRAPMLGRGDQASFDSNTIAIPVTNKKDINGNPRHINGTDIGCFESTGNAGFKLEWAMDALFLSPKMNVESEHPALLFRNDENAYVEWNVSVVSATNYTLNPAYSSGAGNGLSLGLIKLTTTVANTTNNQYERGSVKLSSKLGAYLPDATLKVYQTPGQSSVWTAGYVGSFHRWNETKERYIQGYNTGAWSVRIISGMDWIKIDDNPRGYNGGEVVEAFGGSISGKTGNIIFRVGMKSQLANASAKPRYGLIVIQRSGGIALFFVRQGEQADYIYTTSDPRDGGRAYARKMSPYNLSANFGTNTSVTLSSSNKGVFTDYPSKLGGFFQWNTPIAYSTDPAKTFTIPSVVQSSWSTARETCPNGYHTPSIEEFGQSLYLNRPDLSTGHFNTNFAWGRYADGYYDVIHTDLTTAGPVKLGSGNNTAANGILMYNDFDNAAVFFPIVGYRSSPNGVFSVVTSAWYWTSSLRSSSNPWNTHWSNGHIGMSCTSLAKQQAAPVRCVAN